ncbi:11557_t:CDS:2, partial [Gigaspora rosea]
MSKNPFDETYEIPDENKDSKTNGLSTNERIGKRALPNIRMVKEDPRDSNSKNDHMIGAKARADDE